jgi:hypothetical protein
MAQADVLTSAGEVRTRQGDILEHWLTSGSYRPSSWYGPEDHRLLCEPQVTAGEFHSKPLSLRGSITDALLRRGKRPV